MNSRFLVIPAFVLGTVALPAQHFNLVSQLTLAPSGGGLTVLSVAPAGEHVICSFVQDGQTKSVDVSDVQNPVICTGTPYNPPYWDQFADGIWSPIYGGRFFTAHRFGGLNMLDASDPCALSPLASVATHYSHEGLSLWQVPCPDSNVGGYLFYSEQHTAPGGLGGLIIYPVTAGALGTPATALSVQRGGLALDVTKNGNLAFQIAYNTNISFVPHLMVYDTSNKAAPSLVQDFLLPGNDQYPDCDLELNPSETHVFAALGWAGLQAIDVTTPAAPVVSSVITDTTLWIEGLTFFGKDVLLASGRIYSGSTWSNFFAALNVVNPAAPTLLAFIDPGITIRDMKIEDGHLYLAGPDATGNQILQIWI